MPDFGVLIDRLMAAGFFSTAIVIALCAFLLQVAAHDPELARAVSWVAMGATAALLLLAVYFILF